MLITRLLPDLINFVGTLTELHFTLPLSCQEMHAHSQFCWSGDHTVSALEKAISHAASIDADDRIVIAFR